MGRVAWIVFPGLLLAACQDLKVGHAGQPCNDKDMCLPGLECVMGICQEPGADGGEPDGGGDDGADGEAADGDGLAGDDGSGSDGDIPAGDDGSGPDGDGTAGDDQDAFPAPVHGWSDGWGANGTQRPVAVAVDGQWAVILLGEYNAAFSIGVENLPSAISTDVFLAKINAADTLVWARGFGSSGEQHAAALVVDGDDNIYIAGWFERTLDLNTLGGVQGPALESSGDFDIYAARFDADGQHVWSRDWGDGEFQQARALALGPEGNLYLTGSFTGTIDLGAAGSLTSTTLEDAFVIRIDTSGLPVSGQRFGGDLHQRGMALAADLTNGKIYVAGEYIGEPGLACASLPTTPTPQFNVFLARFGTSLQAGCDWAIVLASGGVYGWANVRAISVDASGDVALTGGFESSISIAAPATGQPSTLNGAGDVDVWVAKFGASGQHRWWASFGDGTYQEGTALAVEPDGLVWLAGEFLREIDLGGELLTSGDFDTDLFLAVFSAQGQHLWSVDYGAYQNQEPTHMVLGPNRSIYLTGTNKGTVDFGGGEILSQGAQDEDVFVVRFDQPGGG